MKWNPFSQSYSPSERLLLDFLRKCELFQQLSDRQLYHFLPYMFERKYRHNEVVFFCNDPSQALYIVKAGSVSLTLDVQEKFEELGEVEEYDFFGENALLKDSKRIYNAISQSEHTVLNIIPKVHIEELFEDHPKIKAKMMEALCLAYNERFETVFREYKNALGFFELGRVFSQTFKHH